MKILVSIRTILFYLLIFSPTYASNAQNIISTICGDDSCGYNGDGGKAINARICEPISIATDPGGNIFFTDNNIVIRRIDKTTGTITTIAGTGTSGFSGDGGPAINAKFGGVILLAAGSKGDLFIIDCNNNRVRKIDDAFKIQTIAGNGKTGFAGDGGIADSAEFKGLGGSYNSGGIAVDTNDNIYVTDNGNNRVRRIDGKTGIITTIAGNGVFKDSGDGGLATLAEIRGPEAVGLDRLGNLYIVEINDNIRKVNLKTGIISTIVHARSPYSGDGGLADTAGYDQILDIIADDSNNLYLSDSYDNVVRKINSKTGIITTVAGNGFGHGTFGGGFSGDGHPADSAEMNKPTGLAFDNLGNLLIADGRNNRLRKMTTDTSTHVSVTNIINSNEKIKVYPTITSGLVYIDIPLDYDLTNIRLQNISGEKINCQIKKFSTTVTLDIKNYPTGMYIVQVVSGTKVNNFRIIKQ